MSFYRHARSAAAAAAAASAAANPEDIGYGEAIRLIESDQEEGDSPSEDEEEAVVRRVQAESWRESQGLEAAPSAAASSAAAASPEQTAAELGEDDTVLDLDRFVDQEAAGAYHCAICQHVATQPVTHSGCQHVMCDPCLRQAGAYSLVACPACREPFPFGMCRESNPLLESQVARLTIRCKNEGCEETYPVGKALANELSHQKVCTFRPLACKHCNKKIPHSTHASHQVSCPEREVTCCHCVASMPYRLLDAHQIETAAALGCSGFMYCPNDCFPSDASENPAKRQRLSDGVASASAAADDRPTILLRTELGKHLAVCPRTPIPCVICKEMVPRNGMATHKKVRVAAHMEIMMKRLEESASVMPLRMQRVGLGLVFVNANALKVDTLKYDITSNAIVGSGCFDLTLRTKKLTVHSGQAVIDFKCRGNRRHAASPEAHTWKIKVSQVGLTRPGDARADIVNNHGFNIAHVLPTGSRHDFSTEFDNDQRTFDLFGLSALDPTHINIIGSYGLRIEVYRSE